MQHLRPVTLIFQQLVEEARQVGQEGQIILHVLFGLQLVEPEYDGDIRLDAGELRQGLEVAVELLALQLPLAELIHGVEGHLVLGGEGALVQGIHAAQGILDEQVPLPVRILLVGAQRALHAVVVDAEGGRILHQLMEAGDVGLQVFPEKVPVDVRPGFRRLRYGRRRVRRRSRRLCRRFRRRRSCRFRRRRSRRCSRGYGRRRSRGLGLGIRFDGHADAARQTQQHHGQGQQQGDGSFHALVSFSVRHLW